MQSTEPSLFYTGLVADLYAALRSTDPDPEPCAAFIERHGQPALELGCGDGDPLLNLLGRGLAVEGLDSSSDMLDRCRVRASALGIDVTLHHAAIEDMDLGRLYRSIFLAGPTFNLIADDAKVLQALRSVGDHLDPRGAAMIPLFIPPPVKPHHLGRTTERTTDDGAILRCTTVTAKRDEDARLLRSLLRYERIAEGATTTLDREWILHWHTQAAFADLVNQAGLHVSGVLDYEGDIAAPDVGYFVFVVDRS